MDYKFLNNSIEIDNIILPPSDKINPFILKNSYSEMIKAIDFLSSGEVFLYVQGFLGTGKRQFINYLTTFINNEVTVLEYYCKQSTVCDDILLSFLNILENNSNLQNLNFNVKIVSLSSKFQQIITSSQKPYLIILHSLDDVADENKALITGCIEKSLKGQNVKIIASSRALIPNILGNVKCDSKVILKGFSKEIFTEYLKANKIICTETTIEDFYKYTRGYYYYTALVIKIISALKIQLYDFLEKFAKADMQFDDYLGLVYIDLIPGTIKNFFWLLRTVRHGVTLNSLAVYELFDDFSIEYLKTNLMIFQVDETLYVQDYFQQDIDISIPEKTEIKIRKFIINMYEKELKEPLRTRSIMISRQGLRAEIEFHKKCIEEIQNGTRIKKTAQTNINTEELTKKIIVRQESQEKNLDLDEKINKAKKLYTEHNYTKAIECFIEIVDNNDLNKRELNGIRLELAKLYKQIQEYGTSVAYYKLIEKYYSDNKEVINLNYLYYEMAEVYNLNYRPDKAIETIKKVVYSVDTPKELFVTASIMLGNLYSDNGNINDARTYYKKALESIDENTSPKILSELYFKLALSYDDQNDSYNAFAYYKKCIEIQKDNPFKALAYSNMGLYYFDNDNYPDAQECFQKSYEIEKASNNYEGIYFTSSYLAKIYAKDAPKFALNYFLEAKQSAEFIDEDYYRLESGLALGDYYYNKISMNKKALTEYFNALKIAKKMGKTIDSAKIEQRIQDMKLRMDQSTFEEIENKYG